VLASRTRTAQKRQPGLLLTRGAGELTDKMTIAGAAGPAIPAAVRGLDGQPTNSSTHEPRRMDWNPRPELGTSKFLSTVRLGIGPYYTVNSCSRFKMLPALGVQCVPEKM
jgi:hypothetical protein